MASFAGDRYGIDQGLKFSLGQIEKRLEKFDKDVEQAAKDTVVAASREIFIQARERFLPSTVGDVTGPEGDFRPHRRTDQLSNAIAHTATARKTGDVIEGAAYVSRSTDGGRYAKYVEFGTRRTGGPSVRLFTSRPHPYLRPAAELVAKDFNAFVKKHFGIIK